MKKPPTIDYIAGTLGDVEFRETNDPISVGEHRLTVQAHSEEGIASIQIIVGNTDLVSEQTCPAAENPEDCRTEVDEWVMETENFSPGHLYIEVLVTDGDGESSSERYWVNIPEPPPPPAPGTPIPPKFKDVARFREEYGLEKVFPVKNEIELNERIFNLIKAWREPYTPEGQVARATMAQWGVPLRPADAAELEYRDWLYDVNADRIDEWVESTNPGSYAGYYMDHPAGGIMRVGFIESQDEQLESLKTSLSLVGNDRLQVYSTTPTVSYISVKAASQSVSDAIDSNATLRESVINVKEDEAGGAVYVGTPNVAEVESILDQMLGPNAPVTVEYDPGGGSLLSGRFRNAGRMRAGDGIFIKHYTADYPAVHDGNHLCTAGYGAKEKAGERGGQASGASSYLPLAIAAAWTFTKKACTDQLSPTREMKIAGRKSGK